MSVGQFHHDAFVFDGHNDMLLRHLAGEDVTSGREYGHLDLPRMREGGFDGGIFAVWIDPGHPDPESHTLEGLTRSREFLESTPGWRLVLTAGDLSEAQSDGDIAAVLGVEGGYAIGRDLDTVDRLYEAGMRCLTLTWLAPTTWADSAGADAAGAAEADEIHGGLTDFGRRVVDRLQELGCLIDLSHSSDSVARQVLEQVDVPVTVSHSGCRSVARHPRNLPDDLLEALAANGGVLGINLFSAYLDEDYAAAHAALERSVSPRER
ncbi:MAG: membrane dipeptidase, partial [Gemmatimonadota bacterium]